MKKKMIYIVDDERDIRTMLGNLLSQEDYDIRLAKSGKELITLMKAAQPDMILLDVMMPGTDGYEICLQLKSNPDTKHIPVMFLTVLSSPKDVKLAYAVGASAYITKPFEPLELKQKIKQLLGESGSGRTA